MAVVAKLLLFKEAFAFWCWPIIYVLDIKAFSNIKIDAMVSSTFKQEYNGTKPQG